MLSAYEQHLMVSYFVNCASRVDHRSTEASAIASCVEEYGDLLGIRHQASESSEEPNGRGAERVLSRSEWQRVREILDRRLAGTMRVRPDVTARRIRRLARDVQLLRTDASILEILLRYDTQPLLEAMLDEVIGQRTRRSYRHGSPSITNRAIPNLLGISARSYVRRLSVGEPLLQSGLISIDDNGDISVIDRLKRLAYKGADSSIAPQQLLFDMSSPGELEWDDFDHVAEHRDHVESLIRGALRSRQPGVNVLIYGPPGTGKTQFCKTLATRLAVTLYVAGESDDDGDEPCRGERLQELRLAQRLLGNSANSLLLFDEMEDLLAHPAYAGAHYFTPSRGVRGAEGSKVFMNRLLEQTAIPTLWTSNSARWTCPTVLRRMMFALELRQPSPPVRARIWSRQLARQGIESTESDANELAREFDVSPGVAAGAAAGANLVDGDGMTAVRRGVRSLSRVLSDEKPPQRTPAVFDPALIQADVDPVELSERLSRISAQRVALCLSGPPGTGKSAFVRYLAQQMGLEIVQKRTSDLLSMWVGQTEQLIAAAFAEARDDKHFLVFDEADSLLADRRLAHRSWEVSQVNEMLTWMESHPLPFACTTNFDQHLDPATLRRFDFKLALDYLSPEQAMSAFRTFFGLEPPEELRALNALTPGDFAVVRRRATIMERLSDAGSLVKMLQAECEAKPDRPRRIGFGA